MKPPRLPRRRATQTGFSLVTAIFLLVILAMLGAFMLTLSNTQHVTSAQDIQGSRAFREARAGMDWGVAKIQAAPITCPAVLPACASQPAGSDTCSSMTVDSFTVAVACTAHTYDEGGTNHYVFWLESTATAGGAVGGIGYVERTVNAFVEF